MFVLLTYLLTYLNTRHLEDLLRPTGGFGVGLFNGVTQILPRPTLVAMATKLETKLAI